MSYEEVIAAAEAIEQEGGRASVRAVRQRIGYGSYRDIAASLRRRREESGQAEASGRIPEAVRIAGREVAERLWRAASRAAKDRLKTATEKLQENRRAMELELAELAVTIDTLVEQREAARRERGAARKAERAAIARAARLEGELAAAREALDRASSSGDDAE